LLFNRLWGWWQADPVAALFIDAFIFKEGYEALKGREAGNVEERVRE